MGEYRKEKELGRGTYGTVYLASKPSADGDGTRTYVAVKRMYTDTRDCPRHSGILCLRELEMVMCCQHPNIATASKVLHVSPFDVPLSPRRGHRTDKAYLEFPLAVCDLEYMLEHQELDYGTMKDAMCDISRALAYLHARGITHRDVKPNNILVYYNDSTSLLEFRLGDFGAAKVINGKEKNTPRHYYIEYRAPELLLKVQKYGMETDVWALGCVFIEIATHKPPFVAQASTPALVQLRKIINILGMSDGLKALAQQQRVTLNDVTKEPKGLLSLVRNIDRITFDATGPPSWKRWFSLVTRMLETDPNKRITMADVLAGLGDRHSCKPPPKTLIMIRSCPCRTEALRLLKLTGLSEREYDHCVDIVNRATYASNHGAKRLVTAVVNLVNKYWSIEMAPSLSNLLPAEVGKSFRGQPLEEYELTLVRDILEYRIYRPLLSDLVRGRVSREEVIEAAESPLSNGFYIEDIAARLLENNTATGQ